MQRALQPRAARVHGGWICDGGISVSMILRHPGFGLSGRSNDSLAGFGDCMPTLLSMTVSHAWMGRGRNL